MNRILLVVGFTHSHINKFMNEHGLGATAFSITATRPVKSMQSFGAFDFVIMENVKVPTALLEYLQNNGRQVTLHQTPLQRYDQWIGRGIGRFIKKVYRLHKFLFVSRRKPVKSPYSLDE